jgi:hypothetical protein
MKRIIAALFVAAFATASFAQAPHGLGRAAVADPQDCPPGTTSVHPNYKWQDGRFLRDGWVCEVIHPRS